MAKKKGNGEGTIYQRSNGTWCAQISYIDPGTGTRKRKSVSGKTKQEVLKKKREVEGLKDAGRLVDTGKMTLGEWIDRWLEVYKKPSLKPSTWFSYKNIADLHIKPSLGGKQLDRLMASDIQALYNRLSDNGRKVRKRKPRSKKEAERLAQAAEQAPPVKTGLSPKTVRYVHTILSGALNQAVKENRIQFNPALATEPPRLEKKEIQPFTGEQARAFLKAIEDDPIYPIIFTDLGTGLRRGELLGLKWDCVDTVDSTVVICRTLLLINGKLTLQEDTKTKASKATVKLPSEVVKVLKKVRAEQAANKLALGEAYNDQGFVFCWPDGSPYRPDYVYHRYKKLLDWNGFPPARLHDLRHTFCTLLLEAGEDLATVSKLARHSSYSVTADIYGHLTTKMQDKAAEKMDAILKG
jgi:integrase